jgi:glucose-1-phosphate cytidylyltransferase
VLTIDPIQKSQFFINGGFFVLKKEIFDYMEEGDELVDAPFQRLIKKKQLYTYNYRGFWAAMDTFKDKVTFDSLYARGETPWEVWKHKK